MQQSATKLSEMALLFDFSFNAKQRRPVKKISGYTTKKQHNDKVFCITIMKVLKIILIFINWTAVLIIIT